LQSMGEGSRTHREMTEAMSHSGGVVSDGIVARMCWATGETLLVPARNRRSTVDRITGKTGKAGHDERESDGSEVATRWSNVHGAKGPC
jgi:hypothetical protein